MLFACCRVQWRRRPILRRTTGIPLAEVIVTSLRYFALSYCIRIQRPLSGGYGSIGRRSVSVYVVAQGNSETIDWLNLLRSPSSVDMIFWSDIDSVYKKIKGQGHTDRK